MIQRHYGQSISSSRTLDESGGARIGNATLTAPPHQRKDKTRFRSR